MSLNKMFEQQRVIIHQVDLLDHKIYKIGQNMITERKNHLELIVSLELSNEIISLYL